MPDMPLTRKPLSEGDAVAANNGSVNVEVPQPPPMPAPI